MSRKNQEGLTEIKKNKKSIGNVTKVGGVEIHPKFNMTKIS